MAQKRNMPSCGQIFRHWRLKGVARSSEFECFACGNGKKGQTLVRAHILAKAEGGADTLENLHLLCPMCHLDSEMLSGDAYFDWLGADPRQEQAWPAPASGLRVLARMRASGEQRVIEGRAGYWAAPDPAAYGGEKWWTVPMMQEDAVYLGAT